MCDSSKTPPQSAAASPLEALQLPYRPQDPQCYRPGIALVGCGGITRHHLQAYCDAGYPVRGFFDIDRSRATDRRDQFFPQAIVYDCLEDLLANPDIEVVDIATHPSERVPLMESALRAGKHVLSQKPFVTDLDAGERLAQIADEHGLQLAVNQNARWAPHFSYIRQVVRTGWIGPVVAVHFAIHWNHGWVKGSPFEQIPHLVLYDYAIHWFDMLATLMGDEGPVRVFASVACSTEQQVQTPLLGQVLVEYEHAQATLVFDGCNPGKSLDTTYVLGATGNVRSEGIDDNHQQVIVANSLGEWRPVTEGQWFNDGFHGTMGELLLAIEQQRTPENHARQNLRGLALCYAAIHSANTHEPVVPGTIRRLPE
ncbi:Gfo/Idh/MocA family protein [Aeoliella mucimassa]|uniref:Putative oxidoreductase YvaA n=1 Tax=Aeoliella mucimassa TaxID=2527972 RepID=A0A518ARE5_9BACT|nr:Gfo/Idh/MocA family oxidoreductase [Aeoliella mucimassa]QDU57286.1 putative oxidoreductase YvaA [Aeoliella mucimassa]